MLPAASAPLVDSDTLEAYPVQQGVEWEHVTFNPKASIARRLFYYVSLGYFKYKDPNPILQDAYGNIKLGELVALMGPSGAGKSSLMKCLTEGIGYSGFTGKILTRGINEKIRSSIIHQDEKEHLILGLTVKETLMYASQLKNRYWCPPPNFHENNVEELLCHLGLDNKANNPVSKCSGGERKRLAIGVELSEKNKPHILFLDEPTTGLDSSVAFSVIGALRSFAVKNNMAVVATIHQPSEEILNLFHKAIILSGTGAVIYHGNPKVENIQAFLVKTIPNFHNVNKNNIYCFRNPADVIIGISSALKRIQEKDKDGNNRNTDRNKSCCEKVRNILMLSCDVSDFQCLSIPYFRNTSSTQTSQTNERELFERSFFESSEAKYICTKMIEMTQNSYQGLSTNGNSSGDYSYQGLLCRTTSSVSSYLSLYGFWTLLKRTWKLRIVMGIKGLLLRLLIYLLVVGVTTQFYDRDIGEDGGCLILKQPNVTDPMNCSCFETVEEIQTESAVTSNIKLIFFFLLFMSLESLLNVALTFPTEFKLFLHEFQNGWYSAPSYFFAKVLVEIPAQLIIPTAYVIYFYVYTQQADFGIIWNPPGNGTIEGERFKIYLRANYFSGFIAQGLGFLIGILCVESISRAILLSSGTLLGLSFFCGFFKKRIAMTEWQQYLTTFSFLRYSLETMLLSIYGRGRCKEPKQSYALESFGIKDDELGNNWKGFFRLMGFTWGFTFIILQLKASKWFLFKVIRRGLVVTFEFVEKYCVMGWKACRCMYLYECVKEGLRKPFKIIFGILRCICVILIWYFVILGIFPLAVYICIADFFGVWR